MVQKLKRIKPIDIGRYLVGDVTVTRISSKAYRLSGEDQPPKSPKFHSEDCYFEAN